MGAGWRLEQKVKDAGLELSAVFGVKMPAKGLVVDHGSVPFEAHAQGRDSLRRVDD